jgi:uncharacterized protein (TIGR02246 family)
MIRRTLSLVVAVLVGGACNGRGILGFRSQSARAAIAAVTKAKEVAFMKGDADVLAQAYTQDAEWYVPEASIIKGRPAIARAWRSNVGAGGNRLRIDVAEVEQKGDRAYEVGRFIISAPDGAVISAGKYIGIWVRESDGQWRTRRDIFNWDIPPRQPQP